MPNVNPIKYHSAFTMRSDEEFAQAIEELRGLIRPIPSKADVVRRAVMEMLERERKRAARK